MKFKFFLTSLFVNGILNEIMKKSVIANLAFNSLKEAEEVYRQNGKITDESWEILYSFFRDSLTQATELLDNNKVRRFRTQNGSRTFYKVSEYLIFDEINFCHCVIFKIKVLKERECLTCKHVLAMNLGKIMGKFKEETVPANIFEDLLNDYIDFDY